MAQWSAKYKARVSLGKESQAWLTYLYLICFDTVLYLVLESVDAFRALSVLPEAARVQLRGLRTSSDDAPLWL